MRRSRTGEILTGILAIAATYVAFLLFAQFGFLRQLQTDLGDTARVRAAMAAMGGAGLAASLATAWLLGRVRGPLLVRGGLLGVALVAAGSVFCHGFASLVAMAAAIGAAIGLLTVALAASLPQLVPPGFAGRAAGVATGAAYFVSNLPALFEAAPAARALFPAGLALAAAVAMLAFRVDGSPAGRDAAAPAPGREAAFLPLLATFLVLVWLDSAAFAVVQASPALKALTWGSAGKTLLQGSVHLLAAIVAGAWLDRGRRAGRLVPLAAWGLFAVAFPLLQHGGAGAVLAGPLYAVGISFYSTALVVMPTFFGAGTRPSPRWRAGLLYGVAGWIGSALGVGMAQDLGRIPGAFLLATGAVLAVAWLRPGRRAVRLFGPALALALLGSLVALVPSLGSHRTKSDRTDRSDSSPSPLRGREVYVAEGCIHCHSQYVRPGTRDEAWWGPARPLDRGQRPPLLGTRRQGPDLMQVGNRRSALWQELHLKDPQALNPGSRMPSYARLFAGDDRRGRRGRDLVAYLQSLGAETAEERSRLTAGERPVTPPAAPSPARGAALFARHCAVCHGDQARGDGRFSGALNDPIANLRKPGFWTQAPGPEGEPQARALARLVRHGLPPTSMPGHEWLPDQEAADLVAFVETLPAPVPATDPQEIP